MEDIRPNRVELFNARFSNRQINMLKVLISFLPTSSQKDFSIYIKYMELQYTLQSFRSNNSSSEQYNQAGIYQADTIDLSQVWDELMPYCDEQTGQQFQKMRNLFQTIQNIQEMMEVFETMKELFPEGASNDSNSFGGFSPELFAAMSNMSTDSGMDFSQIMNLFSMTNKEESSGPNPENCNN